MVGDRHPCRGLRRSPHRRLSRTAICRRFSRCAGGDDAPGRGGASTTGSRSRPGSRPAPLRLVPSAGRSRRRAGRHDDGSRHVACGPPRVGVVSGPRGWCDCGGWRCWGGGSGVPSVPPVTWTAWAAHDARVRPRRRPLRCGIVRPTRLLSGGSTVRRSPGSVGALSPRLPRPGPAPTRLPPSAGRSRRRAGRHDDEIGVPRLRRRRRRP